MSVDATSRSRPTQEQRDAVMDKIINDYNEAVKIINEISDLWKQEAQDEADIEKDQEEIKKDLANIDRDYDLAWITCGQSLWDVLVEQNDINHKEADITAKTADLTRIADAIKGLVQKLILLSPAFVSLGAAIDKALDNLLNMLQSLPERLDANILKENFKVMDQIIDTHIQALILKAAQIKDSALLGTYTDSDDFNSMRDIVSEMIQSQSAELSLLSTLRSELAKEEKDPGYDTNYYTSDKNKANSEIWMFPLTPGSQTGRIKNDDAAIQNAKTMLNIMNDSIGDMRSEFIHLAPDFIQIYQMLQMIMKEVFDTLSDPNISDEAKQAKIMNLFVFVMSLITMIQQYVMKYKSSTDKEMSQATLTAQEMKTRDAVTNAKALTEIEKNAYISKVLMAVVVVIVSVIMLAMTVASAGSAAGIAVAVMTALFAAVAVVDLALTCMHKESATDLLTKAIAKHIGTGDAVDVALIALFPFIVGIADLVFKGKPTDEQKKIVADVLVGFIEIGLTFGVAGAVKGAVTGAEKAALTAVTEAIEKTIEETAKTAAFRAGSEISEMLGSFVAAEATPQIEAIAKTAAKEAARQVFENLVQRNLASLISKASEVIKAGGIKALMQKAAEQAAEQAAKETADVMISIGKASNFTALESLQFQNIATSIASISAASALQPVNQAAADTKTTGPWENFKAKMTQMVAPAKEPAKVAAVIAAELGANNLLVDVAKEAQKRSKKMSDENFQILLMTLGLIQQLLQSLAMMGGAATSLASGGTKSLLTLERAFSVLPNVGTLVGKTGEGVALLEEAAVEKIMAIDQAQNEVLALLLKQMQKRSETDNQQAVQEQVESAQSTFSLSSNLWRNYDATSQALMA